MQKRKIEIKNFVGWQEILAIFAILAGIFFIIATEQIEIKFIGIALVILSFVGLVLLLAQKMSDYVEPQKMRGAAPTPNFKVTVRQDSQAKRVVIEDFNSTIAAEENRETLNSSQAIRNTEAEGFRIIRKVAHTNIASTPLEQDNNNPIAKEEPSQKDKYRNDIFVAEPIIEDSIIEEVISQRQLDSPAITFDAEPTNAIALEEEMMEEIAIEEATIEEENLVAEEETLEEIEDELIESNLPEFANQPDTETIANEIKPLEEEYIEQLKEEEIKEAEAIDWAEELESDNAKIYNLQTEAATDEPVQKAVAFNQQDDNGFKIVIRTKDLDNTHPIQTTTAQEPQVEIPKVVINSEPFAEIQTADTDYESIEIDAPANTNSFDDFRDSLDEELERKPETPEVLIAPKQEYKQNEIDLSLINQEDTDYISDEPRKEFNFLLTKVLMTIRSVSNTKTALLLLVNHERGELILESYVTENQSSFISGRKLKLGNDIISQIVKTGKPEILSEINPAAELDLIPYYKNGTNTSSFVGMPVFFENKVIGVLCADSDDAEAYDNLIVGFLGHFTQIISITLKNFTEKYDLMQDSRTLQYIKFFQNIANTATDYDEVNSALIEAVAKIIDCAAIGIAAYDIDSGWHINMLSSIYDEYSGFIGKKIEIENSIIGMSIREMGIKIYNPIDGDQIRVVAEERPQNGGYFLTIPLVANGSSFGALFVEGENSDALTEIEIELIRTIVSFANNTIEKLHYMELLRNGIVVDPNTGVMNFTAFSDRLKEEMYKAAEFEQLSILAFVKIDKYSSLDPHEFSERFKFAKSVLIKNINKNSRVFDLVGEVDDYTEAVLLIGFDLNKAKLWAEKLRNEVANNAFEYEGHKYNFTISIGLAEITGASNVAGLYNNADTALNLSLEQTNTVSIYS